MTLILKPDFFIYETKSHRIVQFYEAKPRKIDKDLTLE